MQEISVVARGARKLGIPPTLKAKQRMEREMQKLIAAENKAVEKKRKQLQKEECVLIVVAQLNQRLSGQRRLRSH